MVLEIIKNRCSVRRFSENPVSDESVLNVLEAARLAPSWMNIQPWQFIVIRNSETKELLSQLSHGQPHVAKAPVVIACCGDLNSWEIGPFKKLLESKPGLTEEKVNTMLNHPGFNPKIKGAEGALIRTLEELTYAIAYMTIEAEASGLGVCVIGALGNEITGSMLDIYTKAKEKLNMPEHISLITMLTLGYPAEDSIKPKKSRKAPEEIISYEKYGNRTL